MAEMTVNEFINSMKEAGFDFKYTATNGEYNEKLEYVKSRLDVANEIIKDNAKLEVYRRRYHQLVDGEGCHFAETDDNWYDVELMNKTLDNQALEECN